MGTVSSLGALMCIGFGALGYGTVVSMLLAPLWIYLGGAMTLGLVLIVAPEPSLDSEPLCDARVALVVRAPAAECAICLAHADAPVALACGHAFHAACVARWIARRATCPLCRARIGIERSSSHT